VNEALVRAVKRVDRSVLFSASALVAVGLLTIASAANDADRVTWTGQFKMFGVGLALLGPLVVIPYSKIVRFAGWAYAGLLVALVLVLAIGPVINGSQRWLRIGFAFQPSEPLKLVLVAVLARFFRFGRPVRSARDWIVALTMITLPVLLVAKQPDLGSALLFVPVGLAVLFAAGLPWRGLLALGALGAVLGVVTFMFLLRPYQRERVLSTVFRERLADYERAREGWQLHQSLAAVRSGGLVGQGFCDGPVTQSGKLPYAYSDFAFAAVAEEYGFLGASAVLLVVLLLVLSIFRIGLLTRDPTGRLLCVGVGTLIAVQTVINVGVALGVVPTTGVPMPFVSHGGSSLVTFLAGVGLVLNVSVHRVAALRGDS
jgi:rod shape determining protein RodA